MVNASQVPNSSTFLTSDPLPASVQCLIAVRQAAEIEEAQRPKGHTAFFFFPLTPRDPQGPESVARPFPKTH